jgi:predicted O-linked N-acetylglucosamine transferase (SPINDLY family)
MLGNLLKRLASFGRVREPAAVASAFSVEEAERLIAAGNRAGDRGNLREACECYRKAVDMAPGCAKAQFHLGMGLEVLGDPGSARLAFEAALALDPGYADASYRLANLHYARGALQDAEKFLRLALESKPDFTDAYGVLFHVYDAQGNLAAAAAALERALKLRPDWVGALHNYAVVLRRLRRLTEAEAALRRAIAAAPEFVSAHQELGAVLFNQSRIAEAFEAFGSARRLAPERFDLESAELFMLNFTDDISSDALFAKHKSFGARIEKVYAPRFEPFRNPCDPERRLRIGYVSGDFNHHPVTFFLMPLLDRHLRTAYEVYCYSVGAKVDDITRRAQAKADVWRSMASVPDTKLADAINQDGIDILVDLSGHSGEPRLAVFAQQPAPVQITWLGYPNTTGLTRIQYRLSDRYADPPELSDHVHTETLLRLPGSQWCYRPAVSVGVSNVPPRRRNGYITFGSFNQVTKLSSATRRLWAEILARLPDSRLLVAGVPEGCARERLLQDLGGTRAAAGRITFAPPVAIDEYFRRFNSIDIALDPTPYSGCTTTCDTLWMGVPVITLPGSMPASRTTASILSAVGLSDWIASTPEDYVRMAVDRAGDEALLTELLGSLREKMRSSSLMDEGGFAQNVEDAYRRAWRSWCDRRLKSVASIVELGEPSSAGWNALGRDDFRAAEEIARRALTKNPRDAESLHLLGTSLLCQERFGEALAPLREALEKAPRRGLGHRLGYCYLALGDFKSAELVLKREVEAYPDLIDAHNALGVALVNQSRREDALKVFLEAARLNPQSAEANNNAGNVLTDLGRNEEAIPYLQKAIDVKPDLADAHHNLGMSFQKLKRHEDAIDSLQKALSIAPHARYTLSHLVWNELAICRWHDLGSRIDFLRAEVRDRNVAASPFTFVAVSPSPAEQRICAALHVRENFPTLPPPLWQGIRYRHPKIRLAYLSADFSEHATAQLAAGLFEQHDRSQFEICGISYGPDDHSPMRKRLIAGFDRFVDARAEADASVARMLRESEVDIAIDLKGHTTDARPGILAYRPAPIQVSYLGFPGTSGAQFIDYLLADRFVLPEQDQQFYTEKVVYLPDCYQVNDAGRTIADQTPSRAAAGLPASGFVFCCFNNNFKINPQMFDIWMRLLRALPESVLWLLEDNCDAKRNLIGEAQARGITADRLVFASRLPHPEHLARHRLADLFLDTLPYNAHTTASDALWTGLPLLTCAGGAFAGRVAGSLLRAIGLPELVTHTLQDYEMLAFKLAKDAQLLSELRAKLARNRGTEPLFCTDRFRGHIESAYRTMWEIWQSGGQPSAFAVDPIK